MKKALLTLVIFMAITNTYAQKVKLKKDVILIDKIEKYKFERTKKGNMILDVLPNYVIKDMKGQEIMVFKDSTMYFTQLPNETEKRGYKNVFLFSSPTLGTKAVFPKKASLNYKKYIVNSFKKTDFFKGESFTEQHFNGFVEMQELDLLEEWNTYLAATNSVRTQNYEKTKEMFSALKERKPAVVTVSDLEIKEGSKKLGKFKVKKKGSYATTYDILDTEKKTIGTIAIIHKDQEANLKPFVLDEFVNFKFEKDSNGQYPTLEAKLIKAVTYLIEQGYM